ncbi:MAG: site-specific integrase [Streptosporangiales bacterium]
MREELVVRNVARLVELPEWRRSTIRPWSAAEARQFLTAAKPDPLYSAFVVLIFYGLRRGEALGLRWDDIGTDTIHIRQQLQRIRGELLLAPLKTHAGKRDLPLLDVVRQALHHVRHTVGSMLKDPGVPARDAQNILGHTRISATLEIYTDTDEHARRDALTRLHGLLDQGQN